MQYNMQRASDYTRTIFRVTKDRANEEDKWANAPRNNVNLVGQLKAVPSESCFIEAEPSNNKKPKIESCKYKQFQTGSTYYYCYAISLRSLQLTPN